MTGRLGLSLLLPFNQVERVGRFNDIFAKVQPESFLRSAVANRFSLGTAKQIGQ